MSVTIANIIIGPCSSFKVDNVDLGGTSGGVTVEKKQSLVDLQVDQLPAVLKKAIKEETYTVKTSLSEATLANLQIAWGASAAPVVNAGAGTTTLNIGIEKNVIEHNLVFVGPGIGGTNKLRTFTLNRAISMVTGSQQISKDKETVFPVEFACLPDLTKAAGSEYGTVVDS